MSSSLPRYCRRLAGATPLSEKGFGIASARSSRLFEQPIDDSASLTTRRSGLAYVSLMVTAPLTWLGWRRRALAATCCARPHLGQIDDQVHTGEDLAQEQARDPAPARPAQARVTSTAVSLTCVVAMILGVGATCILMDYTAATLGSSNSFLLGVLVGSVIAGAVGRVGKDHRVQRHRRELDSWAAHLADTAMVRLDERLP
ncbi:hypothetical protein ACFVKB_36455 [Rhodococcus sp. NPDC127530]|uniref:hypothetical protein n=1 Tax=unclassified Rhodococcus (in: high G+C Gram-positive bacteria) TaxID=192944 RepID=UPI003624EEF4